MKRLTNRWNRIHPAANYRTRSRKRPVVETLERRELLAAAILDTAGSAPTAEVSVAEVSADWSDQTVKSDTVSIKGADDGAGPSVHGFSKGPVTLPTNLTDGESFLWDVQTDGRIDDGTSDAYDDGHVLVGFSGNSAATLESNDREIVIPAETESSGASVSRKIYVSDDQGFARFLEIVTNPTASSITHTVNISTNLGSDSATTVLGTSSGDTTFDAADDWVVTDDASNGASGGDPVVTHVVSGPGGIDPTTATQPGGAIGYTYDLTLAPGETQIVMHFGAQSNDGPSGLAKAASLRSLQLGAIDGMSTAELAQVVNFDTTTASFANRLYVYEDNTGQILEVDPANGATLNTFAAPVAASAADVGLATSRTSLFFGSNSNQPIYELDLDTGEIIRAIPNPSISISVSGLSVIGDELFVERDFDDPDIFVIDLVSETVVRSFDVNLFEALASDGTRLYGVDGSLLFNIDLVTGTRTPIYRLSNSSGVEGLGVIGDELFASSTNRVDVYDLATGAFLRSLSGFNNLEAIGADGGNTPLNFAPAAAIDSILIVADTPRSITNALLANDSDFGNDPLQIIGIAVAPTNGTITEPSPGNFVYTPNSGYVGTDTFDYTVSDGTLTDTATVNVNVGEVNLSFDLFDDEDFRWDVQTDGRIDNGTSDAYDGGHDLVGFPTVATASIDSPRELSRGPATIGDVTVTRKVYVPAGQAFARFLEIVTNPTAAPVTYTVSVNTNLGSDSSTVNLGTSSGDATFDTADDWIVTDDASNGASGGDPVVTHVVSGPGGIDPTTASRSSDDIVYTYDLTLAPGETQIVMHFGAQSNDGSSGLAKAASLRSLQLGAIDGMSAAELSQVVNFDATAAPFANRLYVYEDNTGQILEVDPATGATLNTFAAPFAASTADVGLATSRTSLFFGSNSNQPIYELDLDTGEIIRAIPNPSISVSGLSVIGDELFVERDSGDPDIFVIDLVSETVVRSFDVNLFEALASDGTRLYGVAENLLYGIDLVTGTRTPIYQLSNSSGVEGLGVIGDELFASTPGRVDVYELATGAFLRSLSGFNNLEAIGADGGNTPSNFAPVGVDDSLQTGVNEALLFTGDSLIANDIDFEGSTLSFIQFARDPANGSIVETDPGHFVYLPNLNYAGQDSFTYEVTDGFTTGIGTVFVTVGTPLPLVLFDADGFQWDIDVDGEIGDGTDDAYDGGHDNSDIGSQGAAALTLGGRQIEFGDSVAGDVIVSRKVYVPTDAAYARFLDVVTNPTALPVTYTVSIDTNLGSDNATNILATSGGDTVFDTLDDWIVTDDSVDGSSGGDPVVTHVVSGPGGIDPTTASRSGDDIVYTYDLTLAPGETKSILHFGAQGNDAASSIAKADALRSLQLGALVGLTTAELNSIVNFDAARLPQLSGFHYIDDNQNGVRDSDESRSAGVTVYLDLDNDGQLGPLDPVTVTTADDPSTPGVDETGYYEFSGLIDGDYVVRQVAEEPFSVSAPFSSQPSSLETFSVGPLNAGIAAVDANTGSGWLMFSVESVFDRFSGASPLATGSAINSQHLVAVRLDGGTWQYDNNNAWFDFIPTNGDRLLAEIDFSADTITSLQGIRDSVGGIDAGYETGDLVFQADRFAGANNDGEFQVTGTTFDAFTGGPLISVPIGVLNAGIGATDSNTGTGFLMHSPVNLFERFPDANLLNSPPFVNSEQLIVVRFDFEMDQWQFDNNNGWIDFDPIPGDRVLAEINFDAGEIVPLDGQSSFADGMQFGFVDGDLIFNADQLNGVANAGEFQVTGTFYNVTPTAVGEGVYQVKIANQQPVFGLDFGNRIEPADFGDAPAPYPTLRDDDGARHGDEGVILGSSVDVELDGVPSPLADGDNNANLDDEEGVTFLDDLVPGQATPIEVLVSGATGGNSRLDAWIDFNDNGSWNDPGEKIFDNLEVFDGINSLLVNVPVDALVTELTFARFRLSEGGSPLPTGPAPDGEVEDYAVSIVERIDLDTFNVGPLGSGIAAQDGNTGTGYILFSEANLFTRFASAPPLSAGSLRNADHLITVRFSGGQWQYDNNAGWHDFTPEPTDRLLAVVDFSADTVDSLQGQVSVVGGIDAGYVGGDLTFFADRFAGAANDGEFEVTGTFFTVPADSADTVTFTLGSLGVGIAAQDNNVGTGYLMYSEESLFTRFASAPPLNSPPFVNSDRLIAVRLVGSQWQYDNNAAWINFTPRPTDRLLADVDFTADTVTSLQGMIGNVGGIDSGYVDGDLVFFADRLAGVANDGEFEVTGTFFTVPAESGATTSVPIGVLNAGIAAQDGNTGTGWLMHSPQNLFTRFAAAPPLSAGAFVNSEQLIAVRLNGSQWQYDSNSAWVNFTPIAGDRLLASIDFDADTITDLIGTASTVEGILAGYIDGDLSFFADQFAGVANDGEFEVTGTFYTIPDTTGGGTTVSIGSLNAGIAVTDNAVGTGFLMFSATDVFSRFSPAPFAGGGLSNASNLIAVRLVGTQWQYNNNDGWFDFTAASGDRLLATIDFSGDTITSLEGTDTVVEGVASGFLSGDLVFQANRFNGANNAGEFEVLGTEFVI